MQSNIFSFDKKIVDDEKVERYLLQIHRIKLIDYINCGLVLPDVYLGEDIENDVQSKNKNFLLEFSSSLFNLIRFSSALLS